MGSNINNWYTDNEYATTEIATLCGDVYFEKYENIKADFIIQLLTPEEPIVNKKVKNIMRAPRVNVTSLNANLESKNYIESNAVTLTIPADLLATLALKMEDDEDGIYKIKSGTKFVVSVMGGSTSVDDMKIVSVYAEKGSNMNSVQTRTAAHNKAGANNIVATPGRTSSGKNRGIIYGSIPKIQ